jgi:spore coat polysaccharide biosynthesis protein SpsF
MGSTRLPGKMLLSLGHNRVIDWVYERCNTTEIGDIWGTTSLADADYASVSWCERSDINYVRGPESNLLKRHLMVADKAGADTVIRINGDCPFVPPAEIHRVCDIYRNNNPHYTTNQTGTVPHGINVDIIPTEVLRRLNSEGHSHPVLPLREADENTTFTESTDWNGFTTPELTLDTPSDYWRFVDAVDAVGGDPRDVARWIENE